ncbi:MULTISPECIES: FIST signal transduction protein [unclassified Lentimicrobium]|uniref:FIST signal transduction protein n=1 Tax=unclassified Lentimicrobium TaxID=2677434 RepID=UPI001555031F|nr:MULTISPECIES: FIST N-terminal domain-containing protein [unclassified Lentimicrobium]NPD44698.1 hypothetical protein [Lentimicrobium sp. S6]NPD83446.1 hypothetical protein [Lentimicrobium sp. L6]
MKTQQFIYFPRQEAKCNIQKFNFYPDLILIFASRSMFADTPLVNMLKKAYPKAIITGCSTSGEINGVNVNDNSLTATAIKFDKTKLKYSEVNIGDFKSSAEAGTHLVQGLVAEDLKHVFVLSEGLQVNGTELVNGVRAGLPEGINTTGGLAGDGALFEKTVVVSNSGEVKSGLITAIGFYGKDIQIGYGSLGGWDSFGIERSVTKSDGNILYEIDNLPALELYKSFLGEKAKDLPASGLLFPLSMRTEAGAEPVVRTILAVDEEKQSLTFAGDIPEGSFIKLMKANIDRLINGAENAAEVSVNPLTDKTAQLAILISCVGRKLVLKQMVEEEVEAVQEVVGENAILTGFYSYGEMAPFLEGAKCELHNQTMTITTFAE